MSGSASSSAASAASGGSGASLLTRLTTFASSYLSYYTTLYQQGWRTRWLTHALIGAGIVFLIARAWWRRYRATYHRDMRSTSVQSEYDYIICGGGSAGCTLAARLSEDPEVSVLLLEAGDSDDVLNVSVPAAAIKLQRDPKYDWCYSTDKQTNAHGGFIDNIGHWPRGKILGGCSALNYMLYVRGAPQDYDSWAEMTGSSSWSYSSLLPYFKKLETLIPGGVPASSQRGTNGPMPCAYIQDPQQTCHTFIKAASETGGLRVHPDYNNGEDLLGVSMSQYNVKGGKRYTTALAYLAPVLRTRTNLHVVTHAHVQRVIFSPEKEAIGVAVKRGTGASLARVNDTIIRAKYEVIVSGGAVGSPQLLELSGIGSPAVLSPLNIPIIHANENVGNNLQDHLCVPLFHEALIPTLSAKAETLSNVFSYLYHGRGPLTGNMVEALGWVKTPAHARSNIPENFRAQTPDIQFHFLCGTISPEELVVFNTKPETLKNWKRLMSSTLQYTNAIMPTLLHPHSTGSIHITSASALHHPRISPNYLTRQEDVDSLVEGCLIALKMYENPDLKKITGKILIDEFVQNNPYSREKEPRKYFEYYVRQVAGTLYHPVGTCKMGAKNDPTAVVDPELRVIGVKRLRVVDASVMPLLVSGNTNIPTVMIGEKAADLIKQARKDLLQQGEKAEKKPEEKKSSEPTLKKRAKL